MKDGVFGIADLCSGADVVVLGAVGDANGELADAHVQILIAFNPSDGEIANTQLEFQVGLRGNADGDVRSLMVVLVFRQLQVYGGAVAGYVKSSDPGLDSRVVVKRLRLNLQTDGLFFIATNHAHFANVDFHDQRAVCGHALADDQ